MAVLEVRQVSRTYRKDRRVIEALQPVSFDLERGEILGIVGESGSGKSTLLRQIAGIERPDTGEILLEGSRMGRKRKKSYAYMQMVFQNASASFHPRRKIIASMEENLKFLAGIRDKQKQRERIAFYMNKVGLSFEMAKRYPWELSGGQCQRAAIARAVMTEPKILLCDEVTSALDVLTQDKIAALIWQLAKELNLAVLFVSHDIALVGNLCDRILVMSAGRCVEEGKTEDLLENPRQGETRRLLEAALEMGAG